LSDQVSNPTAPATADELTAQVLGHTTPDVNDDTPCCAPDPTADLTPADVFAAIIHRAGLTNHDQDWASMFPNWWDHTNGNMGILRTAVDTAEYAASTGVTIPNLTTYLSAAIIDITAWTNADTTSDEAWTIAGFEARALGDILNHHPAIDPGAYTHPLHQLIHLATKQVGPDLITVYGELCRTGAMGTPHTPYHLNHLHTIHEGATIH